MTNTEWSNNILKPHKLSYILLWSPIIILIIITIAATIYNYFLWIFFAFFTIIIYILYNIKYKKEEYIISKNKIIYNFWNLFSDNSVEININKITQVTSILGFIQNKIFWTWNLIISTAWSSNSKIFFKNIENTMDEYEIIQEKMRHNWFHLLKDKLVQEAKPHWLWIIWEIIWKIWANFFILFIVIVNLISWLEESLTEVNIEWEYYQLIIFLIWTIVTISIISTFIFSYLDLKRRKYDIYTDSIFYTEWFLTKQYSFLPMESVADTENTQSFFSKIFGLHDVIVSSEWSNNQVIFKNMTKWEQMIKNIKFLKDNIIMSENDIIEKIKYKEEKNIIWFKDMIEQPLNYDKEFKSEYQMSMLKSIIIILPTIFLPPLFIVALIWQIIKVKFTKFIIESSSIEKKFEFLTNKHNSFSVEKITWVKIKESILDKILWTCSISFASIWSNSSIVFKNIKKTENLEKNILWKIWIKIEQWSKNIPINFNLINYLKASIWYAIFFTILIIIWIILTIISPIIWWTIFVTIFITILILFWLKYLYNIFFYNKSRYIQKLHENFFESISGIIFITKQYTLLRHIKWIKTKKYPLTNNWTLYFNIAWEQITQTKNKQAISILSNSIKIKFIDKVFQVHDYIDAILNNKVLDKKIINTSKQDIWNSILWISITFAIILFWSFLAISESIIPLIITIVLYWFIAWLIIWSIKVKYYNFEKNRVFYKSWIIYKKQHTILYNKFNFTEKNTGFINKIFKNWNINIYTIWSWSVEMKIKDINNFNDIHEILKK